MRTVDRDLKLLALANVLYATGLGLYSSLVALGSVASVQAIGRLTDHWGGEPEPPACWA